MATWNCTDGNVDPPAGVLLDVITESGDERQLIWDSNLWWLPDKSMYVYFTPRLWRVSEQLDKKARKAAQPADMDAEYDDTNPAGW